MSIHTHPRPSRRQAEFDGTNEECLWFPCWKFIVFIVLIGEYAGHGRRIILCARKKDCLQNELVGAHTLHTRKHTSDIDILLFLKRKGSGLRALWLPASKTRHHKQNDRSIDNATPRSPSNDQGKKFQCVESLIASCDREYQNQDHYDAEALYICGLTYCACLLQWCIQRSGVATPPNYATKLCGVATSLWII